MTVIVEQNPLILCISTQCTAKLFCFFDRRIKVLLISCSDTKAFVLLLKILPDLFQCFWTDQARRIEPSFKLSAWVGLNNVWGIYTDIEANCKCRRNGFKAISHPPLL